MKTELTYLTDSYKKTETAKVLSIETQGKLTFVVLSKTIFYAQGGGQPADRGLITGPNGALQINHVSYNDGLPKHQGELLRGEIKKGDQVELELDWDLRYYYMQLHTAGHVLHEAVVSLWPELKPVDGTHGIGKKLFVSYQGMIDAAQTDQIESTIQEIVDADEPITTEFMTKDQMTAAGIKVPTDLPTNKQLRIMQVGSRPPIPDGGTQLKSTSKLASIKIEDIGYESGQSIVHYSMDLEPVGPKNYQPAPTPQAKKTNRPVSKVSSINLESQIKQTSDQFDVDSQTIDSVEIKTKYLGRKGLVNELTKIISTLDPKARGQAGQAINQLKKDLESKIINLKSKQKKTKDWFDVTAPGIPVAGGHMHPVSKAINEITSIFESIGFTRYRHPEIDWDYYVFEALNTPPNHPARDDQETFFLDQPDHPKMGRMLLTTQTSNGQVREMERLGKPPIRMLNIGKTYRRQISVSHVPMFHQFEGLVVDKGINIGHLKGTVEYFARKFYGPDIKSRLRPHDFRFTEPSFEVDFLCTVCKGTTVRPDGDKCRLCKSGWLEVAGAGMVHPNVLRAGGIDPEEYTGFAFGMGVERAYTLKPGLQLDDVRHLYSNKFEFLWQF